jgi:hypothetical protein
VESGDLSRFRHSGTRAFGARTRDDGALILTIAPRDPIASAMIHVATNSIARRRRAIAVWAVVCV